MLQVNAPMHVSESTIKFLNDTVIDKLQWPSRSPDLNPMENLLGELTRFLTEKDANS